MSQKNFNLEINKNEKYVMDDKQNLWKCSKLF